MWQFRLFLGQCVFTVTKDSCTEAKKRYQLCYANTTRAGGAADSLSIKQELVSHVKVGKHERSPLGHHAGMITKKLVHRFYDLWASS